MQSLQSQHPLLRLSWVNEIVGRFGDSRRDFESGCGASTIDGELSVLGYENDHGEVSEISHAANGKYPFQSSSRGRRWCTNVTIKVNKKRVDEDDG